MMRIILAAVVTFLLVSGASSATAQSPNQQGLTFFGMTPCRVLDTRPGFGGPGADGPLVPGQRYSFDVSGGDAAACGVPAAAKIAMLNFVAVGPAGPGHLVVWPWDTTKVTAPNSSVINYTTNTTIANGIAVPLCDPATATSGSCSEDLWTLASTSGIHLVVDVVGYFAPPGNARRWGLGRPNATRYGTSVNLFPVPYCTNGDVAFGLSRHAVGWGDAAAACPAGTWVCSLAERGTGACNTARPEYDIAGGDPCDARDCHGACLDFASDDHLGWVADGNESGWGGYGRDEKANSVPGGGASCLSLPVWCCSVNSN